jgi:SH3 domain-containing YSC84-like protein 1
MFGVTAPHVVKTTSVIIPGISKICFVRNVMTTKSMFLGASILALAVSAPVVARAASDQQTLIDRASITISDLKRDKEFGTAKTLLQKARAILIVPRLYKGGFFVGGEGGDGLLLTHAQNGWSAPAFYGIGSASFGLQIGLEQSEMILFVMSQKALDALMADQFKIGAEAGLAVVTLGSNVEGATTSAGGADIVTWASSTGAYAGVSLNGSVIKPSPDSDRAYYGRSVTTRDIVYRRAVSNPGAAPLQQALATVR